MVIRQRMAGPKLPTKAQVHVNLIEHGAARRHRPRAGSGEGMAAPPPNQDGGGDPDQRRGAGAPGASLPSPKMAAPVGAVPAPPRAAAPPPLRPSLRPLAVPSRGLRCVRARGERAAGARHGGSGGDRGDQGERGRQRPSRGRRRQRPAEEEGPRARGHGVPGHLQRGDDGRVSLGGQARGGGERASAAGRRAARAAGCGQPQPRGGGGAGSAERGEGWPRCCPAGASSAGRVGWPQVRSGAEPRPARAGERTDGRTDRPAGGPERRRRRRPFIAALVFKTPGRALTSAGVGTRSKFGAGHPSRSCPTDGIGREIDAQDGFLTSLSAVSLNSRVLVLTQLAV